MEHATHPYERIQIKTDVLIIGGGTAGCAAAIRLGCDERLRVLIADKAAIERSGCLAAGVNALNAYISEGRTPQDYVEYARKDAEGIVRDDLLLSLAERVNDVTRRLEALGLVIQKNPDGSYATRGWRNVKINGENIKPLLAQETRAQNNVTVLEHVNLTDLSIDGEHRVTGACGFSVREPVFYEIRARAVLISTGGAAGLYRPNNPGFSRHKMWYPPFNTGAGLAMGIRAGAEMTTFENRFVALRCRDTIAPTGTIAKGVGAKQVNSKGEVYEMKYGLTTPERIYGTVEEKRKGNGPCYLQTRGISRQQEKELYKAYLNMAPSQTLAWMEAGKGPAEADVEIEGTEPYIVGGHTASGYWVDTGRRTTLKGLYAAGDVAGGAPQKYVTGCIAEGEIAAESILSDLCGDPDGSVRREDQEIGEPPEDSDPRVEACFRRYRRFLENPKTGVSAAQAEEAMQKIMDRYAGGIGSDYRYNEAGIRRAKEELSTLDAMVNRLHADDPFELLHIEEQRERMLVCRVLLAHMEARKETRWHVFGENTDYPEQDRAFACYINSVLLDGEIRIRRRPLVTSSSFTHREVEQ